MALREDIGAPLRAARLERGIALVDAARQLDVPEAFLADLEAGRIDAFGPAIHAAAYVRMYARYLGVDENGMLAHTEDASPSEMPADVVRQRRQFLTVAGVLIGLGAVMAVAGVLMFGPGDPGTEISLDDTGVLSSDIDREEPVDDTGTSSRVVERDEPGPQESSDAAGSDEPDAADESESESGTGSAGSGVEEPDETGAEESPARIGRGIRVQLLDGVGDDTAVEGARDELLRLGYEIVFVDRAAGAYQRTTVLHGPDFADQAQALVDADRGFTTTGPDPGFGAPADLHVIVGADWLAAN